MPADSHPPITSRTPIKTTLGALVFSIGLIIGWSISFAFMQRDISELDKRVTSLEVTVKSDHDILTRIDTNVADIQRHLDKLAK